MQCPFCGRLSPDGINTCRFCGKVFDESKPADDIIPNWKIGFEIDGKLNAQPKSSYKSGVTFIAAVMAVIIAVAAAVAVLVPSSGIKNTVKNYSVGYYAGNFYDAYDNSTIDLQKVYDNQSSANSGSPFGSFGDMFGGFFGDPFGFSSGYSSYEDMISSYLNSFMNIQQQRAQQFGSKFKMRVDVKKIQKLKGTDADSLRTAYIKSCGNMLKDGKKGDMYAAYAKIRIKGNTDARQLTMFYLLEIDGKPYVMTDTSLNPFNAG